MILLICLLICFIIYVLLTSYALIRYVLAIEELKKKVSRHDERITMNQTYISNLERLFWPRTLVLSECVTRDDIQQAFLNLLYKETINYKVIKLKNQLALDQEKLNEALGVKRKLS